MALEAALPKRCKHAIAVSALIVTALAVTGCVPAFDRLTVEHLQSISKGAPPESCRVYVEYERQKKVSSSRAFDGRSLRNVEAACKCFERADQDTALLRESCRASVGAYIAYEHAKEK